MDLTCLAFLGALLLMLGLGVLLYDAMRRRRGHNPYPFTELTTHSLDETSLQAQLGLGGVNGGSSPPQPRTVKPNLGAVKVSFLNLYASAVQAGSQLSGWKRRPAGPVAGASKRSPADAVARSASIVPRRAMLMIVSGSLALILLSVTILVTGANTPARPQGIVIAIAPFSGAPLGGSEAGPDPTISLADYILQTAASSKITDVTIRTPRLSPQDDAQAQSERMRLAADFLIWGSYGAGGAITVNLVVAPDFPPALPPWQAYDDPDPSLLVLPARATIYLPAGRGLDPLVPLSLALLRWRTGDFVGAAEAAWGAQATLDENGGSSEARYPSIVRAYALLAAGSYVEASAAVDSVERMGATPASAFLARSYARLFSNDFGGASADADRVIADRDSTNAMLARAYLLRSRARTGAGSLTDALLDLDEAERLDPTLARVHLDRAEAYYRQAQPSLANEEIATLVRVAPGAAPAYRLHGLVRLMQGQPDGALEPLGKARELYTRWIDAQRKDEAQAETAGNAERAHDASDNIVMLNKRLAGIALYEGMALADLARAEDEESFFAAIWRGIRGEQSTAERALAKMTEAARLDPRRPDVPLQLGSFYTDLGQYEQAQEQLQLARDLDPASPEPYLALARMQERAGLIADAAATLETLIANLPRYFPAYDYLYRLYVAAGNPEAGRAALERGLSVEAGTPGDHLWRGRFLIALGRHDEAVDELRAAAANPDLWEAHLLLGDIFASKGRGPDALAEYKAVLDKQPNHEGALLGAGRLLVLAGEPEEAQALFERLTSTAPGNVQGHISLLELLLTKGEVDRAVSQGEKAVAADPNSADAYFFLGTALEEKGDLQRAAAAYQASTERNPQAFQAFLYWARTLFRQDLYASSEEVSSKAIALRPADPQPYRWRAASQLALGGADSALVSLGEALSLSPGDAHSLALTSRAYAAKGDEASAIEYATQAVRANSEDPVGQLALGDAHLTWGRTNEALQAYGIAIELASNKRDAALALTGEGRASLLAGKQEQAKQYFTQAIHRDPTAGEPRLYLGTLYAQAGLADDALREYRSAVTLRPNWPLGLYYLGQAYLLRRDLNNANGAFTRAVQMSPAMFEAWFGLGLANREGNRPQQAIEAFRKATSLRPDYAEAWLYLGLTLEEGGDRAGAVEAFTQAQNTAPNDTVRNQAREALERVQ